MKTIFNQIFTTTIIFLLCLNSIAQTGPGGVGSSAENPLWISADNGTFTDAGTTQAVDGNTIAQWNDLSGNGNNLVQATSNKQPTFQTNEINGHPVIRFNGTTNRMTGDLGDGNFSELTIYSVGRFSQANQGSNYDYLYFLGDAGNDGISLGRHASTDRYYSFTENVVKTGPVLDDSYMMFKQIFNGTSPYHYLEINTTGQSVQSLTNQVSIGKGIVLGTFYTEIHHLNGDLAEIAVFETALNTTQTTIIENYLSTKYDITIANDKYAYDATHGNELAGIGREDAGTDFHDDARGTSVVRIHSPASLGIGDYLLWAHDGAGLTGEDNDIPAAYTADGERWAQVWRVDRTGDPGTVTVEFDITGASLGLDPSKYELLIDNDGTFANVDTRWIGGLSVNGNTVTFTGVTLGDGQYFTLANNGEVDTCISQMSGEWDGEFVWSCGTPDSTMEVILSEGTAVTITDEASAFNLIVDGTLENNDELILKGDLTFSGTGDLISGSNSEITMRGNGDAQNLENNTGGTLRLYNINIVSSGGVIASGNWELSNTINLDEGNFTNSDEFTFLSDASQTAHLGRVNANYDLLGSYNVQRFIGARSVNWSGIASPVHGATFQELDDDLILAGPNLPDGSVCCPMWYSVYSWDAANDVYVPMNNINTAMTNGTGFEIYLADNNFQWNGGTLGFSGSIDVDDQVVAMDDNGDNLNLIGNPYPAFISWTTFSTDNGLAGGADEFWVFDASEGTYTNKGDGDFIPPSQGFWIIMEAGNSVTFSAADQRQVTNVSTFYQDKRPRQEGELIVKLENKNDKYKSYARLREDFMAYPGRDRMDLPTLRNHDTLSCTVSFLPEQESRLMVNYTNTTEEKLSLPLEVTSHQTGEFSLSLEGLEAFSNYQCASITDNQTGIISELEDYSSLEIFIEEENTPQFYTLNLSREPETCENGNLAHYENGPVTISTNEKLVTMDFDLKAPATANIYFYNTTGQQVLSEQISAGYNRHLINASNLSSGIYLVAVEINGEHWTSKIKL